MQLVPKVMIVGLFTPVPLPRGTLTRSQINQAWTDVTAKYDDYQQLQISPDGTAAQFMGATEHTAVGIQPPLLQVRDEIKLTTAKSAEKAENILQLVTRDIAARQFFNLGVKIVFHAEAPNHDAGRFIVENVLRKREEELEDLAAGGEVVAGLKYYSTQPDIAHPESIFSMTIEPSLSEPSEIYLDLDAQWQGPAQLDSVERRCKEAADYVEVTVSRYLDRCAEN
jgi:hypothetical protein